MKALLFAIGLASLNQILSAQQPAATPPPLPPGPWLKKTPVSCQWQVTFAGKSKSTAQSTGDSAKPTPDLTRKKSIAVAKNPDLLVEVTTLSNGATIQRWKAAGLYLTRVNNSEQWMSSTGGSENSFQETDYTKNDFAGFDWISEKNYTGTAEVNGRPCLVFRDKIVTLEPMDIRALSEAAGQAMNYWSEKEEKRKASASADSTPEPTPRPFNLEDYKMTAEATIDAETGMPVMLSYQTEKGNETRTYQILPASSTPLTLPPEAQKIVAAKQERARRLALPPSKP